MASTSTPSTDGPVTLFFRDITRVAGETITGQVDLNVAHAQEDNLEHLQIRLKGTIHWNGDTSTDHKQTIILFNTKVSLWDRGAAFPAPGSHILPCTFQFFTSGNSPTVVSLRWIPPESYHQLCARGRGQEGRVLQNKLSHPQADFSRSRRFAGATTGPGISETRLEWPMEEFYSRRKTPKRDLG
ncbi:hypothetical protein B0H14DRAFT_1529629 [Mycena olivaceomarginata]|nr:hypothetical protein B0H14DRAFT_1529629 [Mycena olivaceomarginata]